MKEGSSTLASQILHAAAWAEVCDALDLQLSPLGLAAIEALAPGFGDVILDVGCGAGQTLVQLAERVGPAGQVIGVDIAPLLISVAERRTKHLGQVRLVQADAQTLDLPASTVDAMFSRFGVMAFDDPAAAFTNFKRILRRSGRLAFCCWRSLRENELDHLPLSAAGFDASADRSAFSFTEPGHIRQILKRAGFNDIAIRPRDENVSSGDLDAMTRVLLKVGPLGRIVRENPCLQADAEPRLRKALAARGDPSHIELRASIWLVAATA